MPTHTSKTQNDQNVMGVEVGKRSGRRSERDEIEKMMVSNLVCVIIDEEMSRLNMREPSIVDAMKDAKIRPSGRGVEEERVERRAGVQKKTKRYIEPSKKQDARPRVRIRRSLRMYEIVELVVDGEERVGE